MEIADAVLTLRTDDAPLRAGLDEAERRIRESLQRMERAVAEVGVDMDEGGAAAVAAAVNALAILGVAITTSGAAATGAAARLAFLTTAAQTLGGASLIAAEMIRSALGQIQATMAALASASAALAAQEAARRQAEEDEEPTPPGAPPPFDGLEVLPGVPVPAAAGRPLLGALHITVERENPRAIQAGIERALVELAQRAELAGATD